MKVFEKICDVLARIFGYLTFVCFFVIMIFIVLNVVLRVLLDSPILGAYEIVEQMMFVGVFCSFGYAQRQGSHIKITMILMHMPRKAAMALCGVTGLISTVIAGFLTYAAYRQFMVVLSYAYTSAMLKFPLWPFYLLEIVTAGVFTLTLLADAIKNFAAVGNEELAKELSADWT